MSRFLHSRLAGLKEYVPGEQPQDRKYIKLNTNESPYPPSPLTLERLNAQRVAELNLYPDPEGKALRQKLAAHYGVERENVIIANGSDEILAFAFMAFCGEGRGIAYPDISYGFYPVYAQLYGLESAVIALDGELAVRAADYEDIGKNIVIANPNAPTGAVLSPDEIEMIVRTNPDHVVMIDEAYVDFGADSSVPLTKKYENLLVIHTYSKSRCLAGGRLGYAIGSAPLISDLQRIRNSFNPYNVGRLTLLAGEAALDDDAYYKRCNGEIIANREYTSQALMQMGFSMPQSRANFIFASHPNISGKTLFTKLRERGVLVRHFDKPRISDYLRITIGTKEQMDAVISALRAILEEEC